ncbi:MAG: chromate transporter [Treponema sp.]|nr:chromate transporter [Treponema sp.]
MSLLELFGIFFYIGLFTIGGGLVAITLMKQTIVDRGLISSETFYNMVAISESTPGPVGVNMATYLGNEFYGVPGAIITTLGEILPSIICILLIAKFLTRFAETTPVKGALFGIRPASIGLVLVATVHILVMSLINIPEDIKSLLTKEGINGFFNWQNIAFYFVILYIRRKTHCHPIIMILCGALFGYLFF